MRTFALLTCDSVNIDEATGKHFIFGHFSSIKVSEFPAKHPALTFFVGLTDMAAGEHFVEVRFGLPTPPAPVAPSAAAKKTFSETPPASPTGIVPLRTLLTQKMASTGPHERLYLISELKDLTFDREGDWQLEVAVDGKSVGTIGLSVGK